MKSLECLKDEVAKVENLEKRINDIEEFVNIAKSSNEIRDVEMELEELEKEIDGFEFRVLFSGEYDRNNAILEIHSGAGGVDAQDWAEMLLRMYSRFSERNNFRSILIDESKGAEAGIKSAVLEVEGSYAYGYLKAEKGVHRLVRLSPFNANNLRQTSFALVEVMPVIEDIEEVKINPKELRIDTYRSSGAGGQHVNKTDSAVRITHIPTGIVASCQSERSQLQNKERAMKLLKAKLHDKFLEERDRKKSKLRGEFQSAEWGSQIRSYVLHPYKMVKDHRTKYETANTERVLDGEINDFIEEYLKKSKV